MNIPFIKTPIHRDIILAVILIPLWWILGVKFFVFHLIVFFAFIKLLIFTSKNHDKIFIPKQVIFLFLFIASYFFSIFINHQDVPTSRILASLNNLSYWIIGLLLILVIYNTINEKNSLEIIKSIFIFGIECVGLVFVSLMLWIAGTQILTFKTLLARILPTPTITKSAPILAYVLQPTVFQKVYFFNFEILRISGFNIFHTHFGTTMAFIIIVSIYFYKIKGKPTWLLFMIGFEGLALLLSLARVAVIAVIIAFITVFVLMNIKKRTSAILILLSIILIIILSQLIPIDQIFERLLAIRHEGTLLRLEVYQYVIDNIHKKPLFGFGFKPYVEDFSIPIGSHSTYLGVMYRTGFIGLILFFSFWISVVVKWLQIKKIMEGNEKLKYSWFYLGIALFTGLLIMTGYDLDTSPIISILFFIFLGILLSFAKIRSFVGGK